MTYVITNNERFVFAYSYIIHLTLFNICSSFFLLRERHFERAVQCSLLIVSFPLYMFCSFFLSNMNVFELNQIPNIPNALVVNQPYGADILMEYVIKGNSAVLKCSIPSFVADFVRVEAWIDEEGTELVPSDNYG